MNSNLFKSLEGGRASYRIKSMMTLLRWDDADWRSPTVFHHPHWFLLFSSSFQLGTRIEGKASENASKPVLEESLREINRSTRSITANWSTVQPAMTWKNPKNLLLRSPVEAPPVKSPLKVLKSPDKIQRIIIQELLAKVRLFSP